MFCAVVLLFVFDKKIPKDAKPSSLLKDFAANTWRLNVYAKNGIYLEPNIWCAQFMRFFLSNFKHVSDTTRHATE